MGITVKKCVYICIACYTNYTQSHLFVSITWYGLSNINKTNLFFHTSCVLSCSSSGLNRGYWKTKCQISTYRNESRISKLLRFKSFVYSLKINLIYFPRKCFAFSLNLTRICYDCIARSSRKLFWCNCGVTLSLDCVAMV